MTLKNPYQFCFSMFSPAGELMEYLNEVDQGTTQGRSTDFSANPRTHQPI